MSCDSILTVMLLCVSPCSSSVVKVILFSVVSVCGCVQLSTHYLLNCLRCHHEIFTEAWISLKMTAFQCTTVCGGDLTSLTF